MRIEQQPAFTRIVEDCKRWHPKTKIHVIGEPSLLDKQDWLDPLVRELLSNCIKRKATAVWVTIDKGRLVVEDDVIHDNPETILSNLNSDTPPTKEGRMGTPGMRKLLDGHGGKLMYHKENGNIIAVATWVW